MRLKAYSWLLLAMIFWGTAFPSSEWATRHVPHTVAAFFRFGGGALVLIAIVAAMRHMPKLNRRQVVWACAAGLVGVFAYNSVFFYGVTLAPAADGGVLFPALTPVITTLVLVLQRKEAAPPLRVVGLTVGVLAAIGFFVATEGLAGGQRRLAGDAVFVGGAAIWSAYTLMSRKVLGGMDPVWSNMIGMVAGSVALGLVAVPGFFEVNWGSLSGGFWLNALWLAVAPTALAYILFSRGIRDVGAGPAATMMFTVPLFATIASFIFLNQSFSMPQAIAATVMLAGAFIAVTSDRKPAAEKAAPQAAENGAAQDATEPEKVIAEPHVTR